MCEIAGKVASGISPPRGMGATKMGVEERVEPPGPHRGAHMHTLQSWASSCQPFGPRVTTSGEVKKGKEKREARASERGHA